MSFLTDEKKDHVARCPAGRGGGKTYLGNARLKTFFHLDAFPKCPKTILASVETPPPHSCNAHLNL